MFCGIIGSDTLPLVDTTGSNLQGHIEGGF